VDDRCVVFVVLISVIGFVGNFVAMCCINFTLCFFSAVSGRRCILATWYLKAVVLCSNGWLDWKLIVVSVVVGFLYISISGCGDFQSMFRSRKFMFPFSSCVRLSFLLLCIWFMWVSMSLGIHVSTVEYYVSRIRELFYVLFFYTSTLPYPIMAFT
jgi:hypothetical protein